jgi:aminomethyltransferase
MTAVRNSVALSRDRHVRYLRVRGVGAYDALDRVFTRELYVRDGQLSMGLLLDEDGIVFADCLLGNDGDEFFLLVEGPGWEALRAYWDCHTAGVDDVELADLDATHAVVSIHGPYAWELLARLVGPEVVGLPFQTFFHDDRFLCCRTGETGEFGYQLLVPWAAADAVWSELTALGAEFDAAEADLDVLDHCALENGFFNIRVEGRERLTPLELQLQWRTSRRKEYVGSEALWKRRQAGVERRTTHLVGEAEMAAGQAVFLGGNRIGRILNAGFSEVRGDWVALALIDLPYAIPGWTDLTIGPSGASARSVSPPVVRNRSLFVDPQVHTYEGRHEDDFPSLVKP